MTPTTSDAPSTPAPGDAPIRIRGEVLHGEARGRELGFPTANVRFPLGAVDRYGVYAGRVDGAPAAVSVGVRPTFGDGLEPLLEAHLLDYDGDLYGQVIDVELHHFVREERPFSDVDDLVETMRSDVRRVRELFAEEDADARTRVGIAVEALRAGRMVVVEGHDAGTRSADLVVAASHASPDAINVLARDARGLVSLVLPAAHCERLGLALLRDGRDAGEGHGRAYTQSIEARDGVTTGISTADRARTIAVAIAPGARARDLVIPGHVFPVRAADGGVLERPAQPEAALELVRLGALSPGAVVCTMLGDDGGLADPDEVARFAHDRGLPVVSVEEVVTHRRAIERGAAGVGVVDLGTLRALAFEAGEGGRVALVLGDVAGDDVLVRMIDGADGSLADALSALKVEGSGVALTPPSGPFDERAAGRVAAGFASLGVRSVRTGGDPRLESVQRLLARRRA